MKCSSSSSSSCSSPVFSGFLKIAEQVFGAAMSCIFSCFRVKHASSSTVKTYSPEDTTVNRNRSPLSSFFIPEENVCVGSKGNGLDVNDLDFEKPKNQAKFIEACGTITETPKEIRKVAACKNDLSSYTGTVESLTYAEKLELESQRVQLPNFNKDSEESLDGAGSQDRTPSSCMTYDDNTERRISRNSSEVNMVENVISTEILSVIDHNTLESSVSSNTTSPTIPCKNKSVRFDRQIDTYSSEMPTAQTLNYSGSSGKLNNAKKPNSYLKTSASKQSDRPIIGLVATHWNDSETASRVSPKWWDGNGIPNSTNKYREDQKVNWIATSFEERLEKALSEETLISQRKKMNVNSEESEESDTAMSQLHPSTHFKSVVSF